MILLDKLLQELKTRGDAVTDSQMLQILRNYRIDEGEEFEWKADFEKKIQERKKSLDGWLRTCN